MTLPAVEKAVVVPLDRAAAFDLFTRRLPEWWPLARRSATAEARSCHVEPRVGGRLFETTRDGGEAMWGRFLTWEEPDHVVFSWHPGLPEEVATFVRVTFTAEGERTRVDVVHHGWERLGERASFLRAAFDGGWPGVLARFVARATGVEPPPWDDVPGCGAR